MLILIYILYIYIYIYVDIAAAGPGAGEGTEPPQGGLGPAEPAGGGSLHMHRYAENYMHLYI